MTQVPANCLQLAVDYTGRHLAGPFLTLQLEHVEFFLSPPPSKPNFNNILGRRFERGTFRPQPNFIFL